MYHCYFCDAMLIHILFALDVDIYYSHVSFALDVDIYCSQLEVRIVCHDVIHNVVHMYCHDMVNIYGSHVLVSIYF